MSLLLSSGLPDCSDQCPVGSAACASTTLTVLAAVDRGTTCLSCLVVDRPTSVCARVDALTFRDRDGDFFVIGFRPPSATVSGETVLRRLLASRAIGGYSLTSGDPARDR